MASQSNEQIKDRAPIPGDAVFQCFDSAVDQGHQGIMRRNVVDIGARWHSIKAVGRARVLPLALASAGSARGNVDAVGIDINHHTVSLRTIREYRSIMPFVVA